MRTGLRVALGAVLASLALAAPAGAASLDAVVMYSDGDYIGQGETRIYHPGNAQIEVGGSTGDLTVGVSGGSLGDSFSLNFAAPPGEVLAPGVYDDAQRAPFREAGRPGIDISGDGRGCNTVAGRFEVRAFDVTEDGLLQRLWIVYEHHCEGGTAALFGEVRLGVAGPESPLAYTPSIVRWPVGEPGAAGTVVPVTFLAVAPVTVDSATLVGADAGDFTLRLDECSGRSLGTGGACSVWVRFTPRSAGTKTAILRIGAAGTAHDVFVQGFSYGGRTRLVMNSDPGDYIGGGAQWSYSSAAGDTIAAGGTRRGVSFGIDGANGDWWYGDFVPAQGDILAAGSTYQATRYPFNGSGAGMDVSGEGRGCNQLSGTFTVTEATFDEDGRLRTFGTSFEQHCEHMTPALRGTFEFRAGDTTPPPPWMVPGPGTVGAPVEVMAPQGAAPAPPPGPDAQADAAEPRPRTAAWSCATPPWAALPLVRGGNRADRLRSRSLAERLIAGGGADRVAARGGSDCVDGGRGNDRIDGGSGADLLLGAAGHDLLVGRSGADVLVGGGGNDVLAGGARADRLYGGAGDDVLAGGPGSDRLDCGRGLDVARTVARGERPSGCERITRARR